MKVRNLILVMVVGLVGGSLWFWYGPHDPCPGGPDGPYEISVFGQLEVKGTLKDGCWDGPHEMYHENGQVWWKVTYSNGEADGPFEQYYENGQLRAKGTWSNATDEETFERYYENGQLRAKGTWSKGEKCGEWIEDGEPVTYDPCPSN